jgi:hypothetical protein
MGAMCFWQSWSRFTGRIPMQIGKEITEFINQYLNCCGAANCAVFKQPMNASFDQKNAHISFRIGILYFFKNHLKPLHSNGFKKMSDATN